MRIARDSENKGKGSNKTDQIDQDTNLEELVRVEEVHVEGFELVPRYILPEKGDTYQ